MVWIVRVVFYSGPAGWSLESIFWMIRWSGKLGWLGQFICLIGWMVNVVKLVKWLGCWNEVVYASVTDCHCLKLIVWDEMS